MKTCNRCKEEKPENDFYKSLNDDGKTVLKQPCKACKAEKRKKRINEYR